MANSPSSASPPSPDMSCPKCLAMETPAKSSMVLDCTSAKLEFTALELLNPAQDSLDDGSIKRDGCSIKEAATDVPHGCSDSRNSCFVIRFEDLNSSEEDGNELAAKSEQSREWETSSDQPVSEQKDEGSVSDVRVSDSDVRVSNSVSNCEDFVSERLDGSNEGEIRSETPAGKPNVESSDLDVKASSSSINRQCSLSKLNARAPVFVPKGIMSFPQASGAVAPSPRNASPSLQSGALAFQSSHLGAPQVVHPSMFQQLETYSVLQQLETYSVTNRFGSDVSVAGHGGESPTTMMDGSSSRASVSRYTGSGSAEQAISGFAPEAVEAELISSQGENSLQDVAVTSVCTTKHALSEELKSKILKQVEFYFSDTNLPTDNYLMKFLKKDPEGFVPIPVVASFRKIKGLAKSPAVVAEALRSSSLLVVSEDGKKVRRAHPLPDVDLEEVQSRTVVAENLPEDHSIPQMEQLFGTVGNVKMVRICRPEAANSANQTAAKFSKTDLLVSNKLHALVEYESIEEAERAVAELTDQRNWRSGLRVRLLLRRTFQGKHGPQYLAKGRKVGADGAEGNDRDEDGATHDGAVEKSGDDPSRQTEALEEQMGDSGFHERDGGRRGRGRNRGRGRGRGQHINNTSRGTPPQSSSPLTAEFTGKPPPGPRMPDGTKGFTMGRGRLLSAEIS